MTRRGESEYQFSLAELSVLAVGVVATAAAVFLFGFYVGRDSASEHAPLDEHVARIPITETPESADKSPPSPPPRAAAVAPPAGVARPESSVEAEPQSGAVVPYTVQVLATRNRSEAEDVRAQLVKRSIGAFISEVEEAGTRWYRVRIGRYDDLTAARAMEARVRREMGLTQAYIVPAAAETR